MVGLSKINQLTNIITTDFYLLVRGDPSFVGLGSWTLEWGLGGKMETESKRAARACMP
jgi:hypothetical protein